MRKKVTKKIFFFAYAPADGVNRAIAGERVDIGADHDGPDDVYYFLPRLRDIAGRFMGTPAATDPANPAETIIINKITNTVIVNIGPPDVLPVPLRFITQHVMCMCVLSTKQKKTPNAWIVRSEQAKNVDG